MTILAAAPAADTEYDCCVVGAGPVGLAFAMESARAGRSVLLVEAGTAVSGKRDIPSRLSARTVVTDAARHAPVEQITRRGIGGTSWLWGGRCVPFERIDFEERDFVPHSQWPITIDDVTPSLSRAAGYLDCGSADFRSTRPGWEGLGEVSMAQLERWARQPKLGPGLGTEVAADPRIHVLLESSLIDLDLDGDGTVRAVTVERRGDEVPIRAKSYVLAMGGLETTRLLLSLQRRRPECFGGIDGPLGRYYMGHATGSIANIVFDDPRQAAELDFQRDEHGVYLRRRFTLSPEAQRRHRVLNTSFYLDNPPFYDQDHRNATLSLVFLGLRIPPVGRRILAEGIRLRHIGPPPYRTAAHVGNVLRRPWRAGLDVLDILRRRYLSRTRKPGFVLRNDGGRYALHYHAEQVPDGDSRMRLDDDGRLEVDYRYLEQDIDSLLRCHELLDAQLRSAGIGHLEYLGGDLDAARRSAWVQATDGFHHIGTTRMSVRPGDGVVDRDCRVHGFDNLYIASSSVFRTAGEANPTFLATCLAVRLADHLAHEEQGAAETRTIEVTP